MTTEHRARRHKDRCAPDGIRQGRSQQCAPACFEFPPFPFCQSRKVPPCECRTVSARCGAWRRNQTAGDPQPPRRTSMGASAATEFQMARRASTRSGRRESQFHARSSPRFCRSFFSQNHTHPEGQKQLQNPDLKPLRKPTETLRASDCKTISRRRFYILYATFWVLH